MTSEKTNPQITVLSLFAGCGGLDIGFREAGFSVVASVELIDVFCKSLKANSDFYGKNHQVICADIRDFSPKQCGIQNVDFVIGGPPCQSFSAAGRRAGGVYGINDIRGTLFWHYCRILTEVNAKGFLFENVRGILSANGGAAWKTIVNAFAETGYKLNHAVLDAAEFGVPQHRERLILIGTKGAEQIRFPLPTHGPMSANKQKYIGAGDAINDLSDPLEKYVPYGGKYESCLLEIPPGSNYLFLTEKMGHPRPRFAWRSRFSDFLYVADPNVPTKTIVASPGKWAGPFHWNKRKFTINELKRLFSYPDNYSLAGTNIEKTKQIGNSVAPHLARILADSVKKQFFGYDTGVQLAPLDFEFHHDVRKGDKARRTRSNVRSNKEFREQDQRDLFENLNIKWPTLKLVAEYYYDAPRSRLLDHGSKRSGHLFKIHAKLDGGVWRCKILGDKSKSLSAKLAVNFIRPIAKSFERIEVEAANFDCNFVAVLWDMVDECVRASSSYDNIQKLYGHFTEPYPQFKASITASDEAMGMGAIKAAVNICNEGFVSKYHPLSILENWLPDLVDANHRAQFLRFCGFDLRNHLTNRTIPENCFRICYPFTTPINSKTFVRWVDDGMHKTADLDSSRDN